MEKKGFFEQLIAYLLRRENRMEKLSRERLKLDYQEGRLPPDLYKRITSESIPCSICSYPVTPDTYGEIIETHSSKKELKVICRHSIDVEW